MQQGEWAGDSPLFPLSFTLNPLWNLNPLGPGWTPLKGRWTPLREFLSKQWNKYTICPKTRFESGFSDKFLYFFYPRTRRSPSLGCPRPHNLLRTPAENSSAPDLASPCTSSFPPPLRLDYTIFSPLLRTFRTVWLTRYPLKQKVSAVFFILTMQQSSLRLYEGECFDFGFK